MNGGGSKSGAAHSAVNWIKSIETSGGVRQWAEYAKEYGKEFAKEDDQTQDGQRIKAELETSVRRIPFGGKYFRDEVKSEEEIGGSPVKDRRGQFVRQRDGESERVRE
jgi:hypothetical protein